MTHAVRNAVIVALLAGAACQPLPDWKRRSVAELTAAAKHADPAVRLDALHSLGRRFEHGMVSAADFVPLMLSAVEDADPMVRSAAAGNLGQRGVPTATSTPVLLSLLEKETNERVRTTAAHAFHYDVPEIEALLPRLMPFWNDANHDVRVMMAVILKKRFPDRRYAPPEEWRRFSREQAAQRARAMDRPPTAENLFYAVSEEDVPVVYLLLKAGVDPNSRRGNGRTPLFQVRVSTRPEIVRMLLDAGADVSLEDKDGHTFRYNFTDSIHREPTNRPFGSEVQELLAAAEKQRR